MNWDPSAHYQSRRVAERYDDERFSSLSGKAFNRLEQYCVARAFARYAAPGSKVLDCPCGTGRLAEVLLKDGFHVVGIDISEAMLDVAKVRLADFGSRFVTRVSDVLALRGDRDKYDGALCARVLMHFPLERQIEFLGALASVTSGPVIFTHSLDTNYQRFRRGIKRLLGHPAPVKYPVSDRGLADLLKGAGLVERDRLRPMRMLTEEVIVVAQRA
jgi:2-polyprenyl-3-methyl-5-hydroxy-6-metoxy-1,4-benzoquinol methylase